MLFNAKQSHIMTFETLISNTDLMWAGCRSLFYDYYSYWVSSFCPRIGVTGLSEGVLLTAARGRQRQRGCISALRSGDLGLLRRHLAGFKHFCFYRLWVSILYSAVARSCPYGIDFWWWWHHLRGNFVQRAIRCKVNVFPQHSLSLCLFAPVGFTWIKTMHFCWWDP